MRQLLSPSSWAQITLLLLCLEVPVLKGWQLGTSESVVQCWGEEVHACVCTFLHVHAQDGISPKLGFIPLEFSESSLFLFLLCVLLRDWWLGLKTEENLFSCVLIVQV